MRRIATAVAAVVLLAGAAHAQGNGKGNDKQGGGGKPAAAMQGGPGNGGGKANRGDGGVSMAASMRGADARGGGNAQANRQGGANKASEQRGNAVQADRGKSSGNGQANRIASGNSEQRGNSQADRGNGNKSQAAVRQDANDRGRGNDNRAVVVDRRDSTVVNVSGRGADRSFIRLGSRGLIDGCPPGLAKKNPPCVPPGLARDNERRLFGYDRPDWWGLSRLGDGRYFYDDGYLLRLGDDGRIGGYVPLLGGALSIGNAWPTYYQPVRLPDYYSSYYNLGPYDSYRYADNVIYRVDPQTSAITSIAALLTGDDFTIGQRMPLGYDVYNVPYGYRDRYYDTPEALYRYSDGYVYQVDPKTRLIAAAIELLAS